MSGHIFPGRAGRCVIVSMIAAVSLLAHAPAKVRAEAPASAGASSGAPAATKLPAADLPESVKSAHERIQKLIHELGNPHYTARRAAAAELRQIGAEAFDSLHAATEDTDPEIAASANYLLRQIAVRWVHADDATTVRALLRQYGQESETTRLQCVVELAKLPQDGGIAGLCRIARYDRSPVVSRTAALAIIRPKGASATRPRIDPAVVEQELGASTRAAATWLHQYLAQLRDPPATVAAWKQLIDQESGRLEKNSAETSNEILFGLLWNLADVYRQVGDHAALAPVFERMLELAEEGSDATIVNLLVWLTENKSWDVLDAFLAKHQSRVEQSKLPLYYAARARAGQGKQDLAEQLAAKAAEIQSQSPFEGFAIAKDLERHGQSEWAEREYRRAIEKQPVESAETFPPRIYLSNLLHDYEREQDAADALEPLVKAVQSEGRVAQIYAKSCEYYSGRFELDFPKADALAARFHFYRAGQYQAEKDLKRAQGELDLAINFDETNADVLIAMYRFPEADANWRESARQRIRKLTQTFQQQIDEDPADATPYNQWAWLVSNTEGDFQKAIRYSHRSLELNANGKFSEASFLDTLGRCYFAAGDYENAVKYEREAIEKEKYMQVMHRQLALFEKTRAEKKAGSKEPKAGAKEPNSPKSL